MDERRVAGCIALVALGVLVLLTALSASGLGSGEHLVGSEWDLVAGVSGLSVLVALAAYAGLGTPWNRWDRTSYW